MSNVSQMLIEYSSWKDALQDQNALTTSGNASLDVLLESITYLVGTSETLSQV